jgi:hypothetical protein
MRRSADAIARARPFIGLARPCIIAGARDRFPSTARELRIRRRDSLWNAGSSRIGGAEDRDTAESAQP